MSLFQLAVRLLMVSYVREELSSYDRFHEDAGRIYRLGFSALENDTWSLSAKNSSAAGTPVAGSFAAVEHVVRLLLYGGTLRYGDRAFREPSVGLPADVLYRMS